MFRLGLVSLIAGLVFLSATGALFAADPAYEQFPERKISDILTADKISGEHYRIREAVQTVGFMDHYTVDSDYGVFEITGDAALRKLLNELNALAAFKKVENTEAFSKALIASAKQPLIFGANVVIHPVDTVTGVPKGVAKLFINALEDLTSKKQTGEDTTAESLLSLSKYKREYAYNLGVDVYSSNPVFQKELNRVGWAAAVGNLSFSAATAPIGGGAGMAVSYTGFAQTMNDYLRDEPPSQIRTDARDKLSSIGVQKDDIRNFLDNASFTPRHTAVIVSSLMKLKDASGRDAFIKYASLAGDEEQANFMMNVAESLKGYHETVSPIKEISVSAGMVIAKAENNSVPIIFPVDYGIWTESVEAILKNIVNSVKSASGKPQLELWIAGTVSPLARKSTEQLGIKITEKVNEKAAFVD